MFVYNVKLNSKNIVKVVFVIIAIIITLFFAISTYKIVSQSFKVKDNINKTAPDILYLTTESYTNVLKSVHDDLDAYIGRKISFTGYVYRLSDFEENHFVLARDMIVSSNMQALIVGFLCESNMSNQFDNNTWVEVTGEITKGNYHGDIPVIKITDIKKIDKPEKDIYVYPPDDSYVPTSVVF